LRSASRNSATVFASTPALLAARDAPREVVFAAFRACCWRPRACPPFLAAARRFEDVPDPDDEEDLRLALLRLRDEPDERLLDVRELDDRLLEPERLLEERLPEPDLLLEERLPDPDRLLDARLDPLDFFDPPLDLLLPLRSAIWLPLVRPTVMGLFPRTRDYLTS
jgi:hypothetical protein